MSTSPNPITNTKRIGSTSKPHNTLIYIGRFQPFHNAHLVTIECAATLADQVIVVIGSANQPRDGDNPFTQEERIAVIRKATRHLDIDIEFVSVENQIYNNMLWGIAVSDAVEPFIKAGRKTALIGHTKDETSFYLTMFPEWGTPIEMTEVELLDATTIRNMYFSPKCNLNFFRNIVPQATMEWLSEFKATSYYNEVCDEVEYINNYKKPYAHLPYPVTFNTGDAVVFKAGHVLMITRKASPGKGLFALPGGFLNANTDSSLLDCAIRELYEETKIKISETVLRNSVVEEKVFSALKRSRRGRVITTAQHIVLDSNQFPDLPKVKGSDDAVSAQWVLVSKLKRNQCFEDHWDIVNYFAGRGK
jgi:bifunctional NMN adenylyltransferase/nudix hydrolase